MIPRDLKPLQNNLLVKVKDKSMTTAGGLYMPDQAVKKPTEGVVIEAGPGRTHPYTGKCIENAVKVGESVLYGKFDGIEIKYDNMAHQLIKDDDVLLTYTGPKPTLYVTLPVVPLSVYHSTFVPSIMISTEVPACIVLMILYHQIRSDYLIFSFLLITLHITHTPYALQSHGAVREGLHSSASPPPYRTRLLRHRRRRV